MQQREAISLLAKAARSAGALIVSEIGSQTCWLYDSGDHPSHLYLSGPMGMAPSVALGVAMSHPKVPVLAICGDGALVMNMSALVTASYLAPANLTLAVMDNGVYDFTGKVPSPSSAVDWVKTAQGLKGFKHVEILAKKPQFSAKRGLSLIHCPVKPAAAKPKAFPFTGPEIHQRFKTYCKSL